jgi:ComF family protein
LTRPPHFSKVTAVFEFDGTAASLLHAAKFGRRTAALELLTQAGQELFERTLQRFSPDWLLPVPLSWRRRFVRGFNQSYLLTHYLREGAASRIPIFSGVKRRHLEAQAKQGLKERLSRLRGVFSVSGGAALAGAGVLIVDDVLTTGATAEALSAALKNEGVREVEVFVLTRVRRMHG